MTKPVTAFILDIRVRFHECDPLGHVNNAVYLQYLEDAAIRHAAAAGWPESRLRAEAGGVFVARKTEIDYLRAAKVDDLLRITTWPSEMRGATAYRSYEIAYLRDTQASALDGRLIDFDTADDPERGAILVKARTLWAFVDPLTGRPRRLTSQVVDDFLEADDEF
jgi:acyl-CoA thioester hydrolase